MHNVDIMPGQSEVVHYDQAGVPLYIRQGRLSDYPEMRAACHWHEDLEFIRVLSGEMRYSVNGETVPLGEGDCLFVNARQMHYGYAHRNRECVFTCTLIHPDLLVANPKLYERYVKPLISGQAAPYLRIAPEDAGYARTAHSLDRVWRLKEEGGDGYEVEAVGLLASLAVYLLGLLPEREEDASRADQKLAAQKKMVTFITGNYAENISLEEIAASANLSKSTCIRLFKTYVHQSPFDFLIAYRLQVARSLLGETARSVTDIATLCGFNNTSYFTRLFHRSYGCTPSAYRRERREQGASAGESVTVGR